MNYRLSVGVYETGLINNNSLDSGIAYPPVILIQEDVRFHDLIQTHDKMLVTEDVCELTFKKDVKRLM